MSPRARMWRTFRRSVQPRRAGLPPVTPHRPARAESGRSWGKRGRSGSGRSETSPRRRPARDQRRRSPPSRRRPSPPGRGGPPPKRRPPRSFTPGRKPTETIVASRPQAKKEEISPRPPSPGDRMRREAMRTRQTADGVPRGGELERPFPPAPVEVPEEQRSGPIPTGNDIGPRTVRPVKEAPRDSLDFSAPDDPSPLPSPSPEIYAGGRPRATDSPAVSERPQAGLRTIRERPRPDAGPREKRPATAAAPKTRRETDRMIRMAGGRGSETAKAWERSATLPAPQND